MGIDVDELKGLVEKQLGVSAAQITLESKIIDDLKADSLDTVELVMALEDRYKVSIPDTDVEQLSTVGGIVGYLNKKLY